jgi:hypothetical protein
MADEQCCASGSMSKKGHRGVVRISRRLHDIVHLGWQKRARLHKGNCLDAGDNASSPRGWIAALEKDAHDAEDRLTRPYTVIETGLADLDDILKERICVLKRSRQGLQTSVSDPPIGFVYKNRTDVDADTVKLGVNYRFN